MLKKRLIWMIPLLLAAVLVSGILLEFALCNRCVSYELTDAVREAVVAHWPAETYGELTWGENQHFYGSYGDCLVVYTKRSGWDTDYTALKVARSMFVSPWPFTVLVLRDGTCMDIRDAYEQGWLTWIQVRSIVTHHQKVWGELAKLPGFAATM